MDVALGETLTCTSLLLERNQLNENREAALGMDESDSVVLIHSLDGSVTCSAAGDRRMVVILVTNQRDEVLVSQHGLAGRAAPMLDPFLWAEVGEGENAAAAALSRVKAVFRDTEVPGVVPLSAREFDGGGRFELFQASLRVPSTKAAQIAQEQGFLHTSFLPVYSILLMAKGSLLPAEMRETVELFLADGPAGGWPYLALI